ncbi:MAG: MarR family winged helix-turn-helix transcriptional regulator [Actinomycetes bacterium]
MPTARSNDTSAERSVDAVRAAARLAKVAGTALFDVDLTLPQYRVLVFLAAGERPASHVAALLGVAPSTVTAAVDGLTARGLVERRADPDDRRRVVLANTADGRQLLRRGDAVVAARLDRLLQFLSDDEADTVLTGLAHLNRAMEHSLAERFGPPGSNDPGRP